MFSVYDGTIGNLPEQVWRDHKERGSKECRWRGRLPALEVITSHPHQIGNVLDADPERMRPEGVTDEIGEIHLGHANRAPVDPNPDLTRTDGREWVQRVSR